MKKENEINRYRKQKKKRQVGGGGGGGEGDKFLSGILAFKVGL